MPSIRRSHLLIGLAALLAAVGLFFVMRAMAGGGDPTAAPSATSASPSVSKPAAQPTPFKLKIAGARGVPIDNTNLYGRQSRPRPGVVKVAAARAGNSLERYLNAAFVQEGSRFSAKPLRSLLTVPAYKGLRKADRAALGVSALKVVSGGEAKAKAWAIVLHRDNDPYAVTLKYRATIDLVVGSADTKPASLVQRGTMVFAPTKGPWRADMADVRLSLPPEPKVEKQPEPTPSEEATS